MTRAVSEAKAFGQTTIRSFERHDDPRPCADFAVFRHHHRTWAAAADHARFHSGAHHRAVAWRHACGRCAGAKRGTLAVLLTILIAGIGLPVLSGGRGGLSIFTTPTTGFLIGWIAAVFVTGFLSEKFVHSGQSALAQGVGFFVASLIGGVVVLYAFGITYLALVVGLGFEKAFMGSLLFIPGDALKAVLAALAGRAVMAGYPLLPQRA